MADVLTVTPNGVDTGTCTSAAPCKTISFAATKAGATRIHIVMNLATYVETILISSIAAPKIFIHGHGSIVTADPTGDGSALTITGNSAALRDLTLVPGIPQVSSTRCVYLLNGTFTLDRIRVMNSCGVHVNGMTTMRDVAFESVGTETAGLTAFGSLTLDRVVIHGGRYGVVGTIATSLDVTNLLVYGTSDLGLWVANATGSVKFSTIANVGSPSGAGPRAVTCTGGLTVSSSIVWAPGIPARASIEGCPLVSSFAGPTAVAGAPNTDPLFIAAGTNDFHLSPNSPAKNLVDSGPAFDFEGEPRPQGPRFDIGADEAP